MSEVPKEYVAITAERLKTLMERDAWLSCLEEAGVDNWEGYSHAYEISQGED